MKRSESPIPRFLAVVISALLPMLSAADEPMKDRAGSSPDKSQLETADAYLNLAYLPEWRYSGDKSGRRDNEMVLVINEDGGVLLIVPAAQKATAKSILSKHFGQKLPACANWVD